MGKRSTPLRERIYGYLKTELGKGTLQPGCFIDVTQLSAQLRISKTPLRDALILLEADGIVSIYPRRGVMVNPVTLEDVRHIYEVCAGLESMLLHTVFDYIAPIHIRRMYEILEEADHVFSAGNFSHAPDLNLRFHHVYRDLSNNRLLKRQLDIVYDRLYYFPPRNFDDKVVQQREKKYWEGHRTLLSLIEAGEQNAASDYLRDVHWALDESYARTLHVLEPAVS